MEVHTDKLSATPRQSMRRSNIRAFRKESCRTSIRAEAASTSPILETSLHKIYANEHNRRTGNNWREDLLQDLWREERKSDFNEGADCSCANESTVSLRTWELVAVTVHRAEAVGIHLGEGAAGHRDDCEGGSDN